MLARDFLVSKIDHLLSVSVDTTAKWLTTGATGRNRLDSESMDHHRNMMAFPVLNEIIAGYLALALLEVVRGITEMVLAEDCPDIMLGVGHITSFRGEAPKAAARYAAEQRLRY